ncbi:PLDc N-terminal domain-containing protein [Sinomonas sp. P47F7]|uniref:PLDc N-terminal domain-containing protein n=1 Tax=Sinomonas sp. P47F7 TaxID=3410987 RepID=UPI003BF53E73
MNGVEALVVVMIFVGWCALLVKITTDIIKTQQSQASKIAWTILVWTIPLLGLVAWAYFRGRPQA